MSTPLVTLGVPVYRGHDRLPMLLECLRTQSYENIEVLISVDAADQQTAEACTQFLQSDSRFRMQVQPTRLGWAGNTDWTMRHRRGDFYIYQQHDDLLSPTYVADLVAASARWQEAVLFFAKLRHTGERDKEITAPSLLGERTDRVLTFLRRLHWVPFRGLIRGSALDQTSGLLLSDFDPFDSLGTEFRFMAELALLGEFRFVDGPVYFKAWHEDNLSTKRKAWSRDHQLMALASWLAWMIEVVAPAGPTIRVRRQLFNATIDRFTVAPHEPPRSIRSVVWAKPFLRAPIRALRRRLAAGDPPKDAAQRPAAWPSVTIEDRGALLRLALERLSRDGRFDPVASLEMTWPELERHTQSLDRSGT